MIKMMETILYYYSLASASSPSRCLIYDFVVVVVQISTCVNEVSQSSLHADKNPVAEVRIADSTNARKLVATRCTRRIETQIQMQTQTPISSQHNNQAKC